MKYILSVLIVSFFVTTAFPQMPVEKVKNRIIRAKEPQLHDSSDSDDKNIPIFEITGIKIGSKSVNFNEQFAADENWLRDLKITVKNISGSTLKCVEVSFGLLETIDKKMMPDESWAWRLPLSMGDCDSKNGKLKNRWRLKNRAEVELTYASSTHPWTRTTLDDGRIGTWEKIVLGEEAFTRNGKGFIESPLLLPKNTKYLTDPPY